MTSVARRQRTRGVCARCEPGRTCPQCTTDLRALNGVPPHAPSLQLARERKVGQYRLTVAQYELMLQEQDEACAICGFKPPFPDDLHIDHNHATGEVRGLLCRTCNYGLGQFRDSPAIIDAALAYLEERGFYGEDIAP